MDVRFENRSKLLNELVIAENLLHQLRDTIHRLPYQFEIKIAEPSTAIDGSGASK